MRLFIDWLVKPIKNVLPPSHAPIFVHRPRDAMNSPERANGEQPPTVQPSQEIVLSVAEAAS